MATLKEFEETLRQHGMTTALSILDELRQRDRKARAAAPARRVTGQKMTPELARRIRELHASTTMTQQEIAFKVGVNQGRVNEVIKRGKWLDGSAGSPEAQARDRALARMKGRPRPASPLRRREDAERRSPPSGATRRRPATAERSQLSFIDL